MRILLDTNVLVSAILFGGLPPTLLDQVLRGDHTLVSSVPLVDELEDVLIERFDFDRATAGLARVELDTIADIVTPSSVQTVSRDPDDDIVLATAVAGQVQVLISGDKDLVVLRHHAGIPIRTPRQFVDGA